MSPSDTIEHIRDYNESVMLDLLRDPLWQFAGVVLAIAAIFATFWVYFLQKPRKRLLVERVARVPLTTLDHQGIPGLQILLNGIAIERSTVTLLRIVNTGNTPLTAGDFETPITLEFESGSKVLHAEILEQAPSSLSVTPHFGESRVEFSKALLNPGDSFLCRTLVQNSDGQYVASARVVGMKDIDRDRRYIPVRSAVGLSASVIMLVAFFFMPKHWDASPFAVFSDQLPYLLATFIAFMGLALSTVTDLRKEIKRLRETRAFLRSPKH